MPKSHCCHKNSGKVDLSTFATYVRQSILCGVEGSSKFLIALSSYMQASVFQKAFRRSISSHDDALLQAVRSTSTASMRAGMLPAFEAFVLMPAVFYILHTYAQLRWVYCLAACWASMFTVCLLARLTRFIKRCPEIAVPMYENHSQPFPLMVDTRDVFNESSVMPECSKKEPLSLWKAVLFSFLFTPFRALTLISMLVVIATELAAVPYAIASDIWNAGIGYCKKDNSTGENQSLFGCTKKRALSLKNMVSDLFVDILWVVSLGCTGAASLMRWSVSVGARECPDAALATGSGKVLHDGSLSSDSSPGPSVDGVQCTQPVAQQCKGCRR